MGSYNGPAGGDLSGLNVDANLDMGAYDLLTDDIKESTATHGVDVDGVLCKDILIPSSSVPKKVSDNLRHSGDTEQHDERADGSTWRLDKTFTLATGIKGTLRFKAQGKVESAPCAINMMHWGKNGSANLGADFVPNNTSYQADSQDIDVGTMVAGETIEVYTKSHDWQGIFIKECRIYYDDDDLGAVTAPETEAW
jgi:hypothetical protein